MPPMLHDILKQIIEAGGQPYEVGGCVRDRILGLTPKDVDIEVFGLTAAVLSGVLEPFGRVNQVGVSFGVIKLRTEDGTEFDFTLPRRESKTGRGHRGFVVEVDHSMTVADAAARRDFTLNAVYRCPLTDELHDPHGGLTDLNRQILRATTAHFAEDPLRVLRGMQFAARFDLTMDAETALLARSLRDEYVTLARERVWGEWHKWATRSKVPSKGMKVLQESGWLELYPELAALPGIPQDPEWHPEGDVWVHTLHVCDVAAAIADRDGLHDEERAILLFAALCHDLGKANTTEFVDGRWRAHGHCETGVPLTRSFLERIGCLESIIEIVEPLVQEHLVHASDSASFRLVRRLAIRLKKANIRQLMQLVEADLGGRPPLPKRLPKNASRIFELSCDLKIEQAGPEPVLLGRHIIQLGYAPDTWFREVLKICFEAQLDGQFETEVDGVAFLQKVMQARQPSG